MIASLQRCNSDLALSKTMAPKTVMKKTHKKDVKKDVEKASLKEAKAKSCSKKGLTAEKLKDHEELLKKSFESAEAVQDALKLLPSKTKECLWKQSLPCTSQTHIVEGC